MKRRYLVTWQSPSGTIESTEHDGPEAEATAFSEQLRTDGKAVAAVVWEIVTFTTTRAPD